MACYEIEHVSRYSYTSPVRHCLMSLCIKPFDDARQQLLSYRITSDPPASINEELDSFGNTKHILNIHRMHKSLEIIARSTVEVAESPPAHSPLETNAWQEIESWRDSFALWDYTHASPLTQPSSSLDSFIGRLDVRKESDPLQIVTNLSDSIYRNFQYAPGSTTAVSPVDHILNSGQGVCQDYAHAMIAIARSWGIPSRYVSGYVFVDGIGGQAPQSATHAWVECLLPTLGWRSFDPTNAVMPSEGHVRIAVGRDYSDVSPTSGVLVSSGESRLEVDVRMRVIDGAST